MKWKLTIGLVDTRSFRFREDEFDDFDRKLFEECNISHRIADKVLALEVLVRKIERSADKF